MQKKKVLGIALVICCVLAAILYFQFRPTPVAGEKEISVLVVHGDQSEKSFVYETDAEYLGEVLLDAALIDGTEGPYGLFVTTVDGETADESKQEWWCISKGGEMTQTSIDTTPITDQDQFELTLKTGY